VGSSFEVPLTPDDRARLNEAADVLVLTRDRREDFVQTIGAIVYTTRLQSRLSSELSDVDGRAIAAANAVRSAYTALAKLSPRQRGQLGVILTHPFMVPRVSAMLAQKRNGGPLIFGRTMSSGKSVIASLCSSGMIPARGWTPPWTSIPKVI
jgi:hypothetical protein